jgi:TonB-dependent SusC/RagA subfamily outer membrane receptor
VMAQAAQAPVGEAAHQVPVGQAARQVSVGQVAHQVPVGQAAHQTPGKDGAPAPPKDTILLHIPKRVPGRFFDLSSVFNTGAVSTVSGEVMYKTPTPNITNTLYGRLSGLTVSSGPGEPGNDNANMGIRGIGTYGLGGSGYNAYKIFIDGFESDINNLSYLSPAEIQSISVLKDAASLSTFGMRGANGVLWVETRRGNSSRPTVQIDARTGLQSPTVLTKPLNSYDYANLYNQAISNDNGDVWTPKYSAAQLQAYQDGTGTNVDWYAHTLRKNAPSTDGDLIFSGGDSIARYMLVMDYANQQGLYASKNTDSTSNEMLKRYNLRTNLDFNFFKIFEAQVDLGGRIQDWKSPNNTTANIWNALASYPNNIYPVKDTGSGGWSGTALYPNNPVASSLALGWQSTHTRVLQGNFRLKEKLDFITPGIYLDEAASFYSDAVSTYSKTATYGRYYQGATTTTDVTTPIKANAQAPYSQENWQQGMVTLGYNEAFGTSKVHAAVNYDQSAYLGDGLYTYEEHYQNISGRGNYSYKDKYIGELGFSYFGSDAYAPGHQWDFYPSLSGAWILSNEHFLKNNTAVSFLKLRASAGLTGSTDSYATGTTLPAFNGRYLYQQYYQAASQTGGTFYTGNSGPTQMAVLTPLYIANPNIGPEFPV